MRELVLALTRCNCSWKLDLCQVLANSARENESVFGGRDVPGTA
jgi:hypothetical protein